jgi:hypothetical protein
MPADGSSRTFTSSRSILGHALITLVNRSPVFACGPSGEDWRKEGYSNSAVAPFGKLPDNGEAFATFACRIAAMT